MRLRYIHILYAVLLAAIPLNAAADPIYKVRKGDNLSRIAKHFHVKAGSIIESNGLESDRLRPGALLAIPSAPTKAEKTAPPAAIAPESPIAGGLKEQAEPPVVKEVKEMSVPPNGGTGGVKEKLIGIARKLLDIPYRFGGSSLLGIDCSGYVQKVFSLLNIVLPRTAREQFHLGKLVGKDDLSIGDLVFFRTYAKFPSHVGIYLGENRFIHASSKERKVTIDSLDTPYFLKRFIGARRLELNEPADEI